MSSVNRRKFMKNSLAFAGSTFVISGTKASGRVVGANDTVRVAVTGIHGRGGSHIGAFQKMKNVEVVSLVDPDATTFPRRIKQVEDAGGKTPKTFQDIRKALDDKELDVLSIATTNHWHSLSTIWACQAGKDVYVEKPLSHNVHEGRIAVAAARKHNCIVQHGTQSRSDSKWWKLAEIAKKQLLGKLLISRALVYKRRKSIGFRPMETPPKEVDYNMWLGPAPEQPYNTNLVHYNWHWFWDFGNGDLGNQGVHQMDIARWMIPGATYPKSTWCLGGRFGYNDQGETANTQVAVVDYGETKMIYEVRGLESKQYMGSGTGDIMHFEAGTVVNGNKFYPKGSDKTASLPKVDVKLGPGGDHFGNFMAAVRSRKQSDLNADVLEGHLSCIPIHLINISYRLGENVLFDDKNRRLNKDEDATDAYERMIEHLKNNDLNPDWMCYRMGPLLKFNAKNESISGNRDANKLLTREYREPFVVPEKLS